MCYIADLSESESREKLAIRLTRKVTGGKL